MVTEFRPGPVVPLPNYPLSPTSSHYAHVYYIMLPDDFLGDPESSSLLYSRVGFTCSRTFTHSLHQTGSCIKPVKCPTYINEYQTWYGTRRLFVATNMKFCLLRYGKDRGQGNGSMGKVMDSSYNLNHLLCENCGLFLAPSRRGKYCAGFPHALFQFP